MDIFALKNMKKEAGLINSEIAELSGIPLSTVNKIFSGATKNPRYATLLAIEQVLATKKKIPFTYDESREEPVMLREEVTAYEYNARYYKKNDIEQLSEGTRAELIDGKLYMLAAPSRMHQFLVTNVMFEIKSYIRKNKGGCHVYTSPFDVRLFEDERTIVQPDILVVCQRDKLTEKGCVGAPDWVVEIVSKSNSSHDYIRKMIQYQKSGVREYWIIDPFQELITVYNFENPRLTGQFSYEDRVPSGILEGFAVRIEDFREEF